MLAFGALQVSPPRSSCNKIHKQSGRVRSSTWSAVAPSALACLALVQIPSQRTQVTMLPLRHLRTQICGGERALRALEWKQPAVLMRLSSVYSVQTASRSTWGVAECVCGVLVSTSSVPTLVPGVRDCSRCSEWSGEEDSIYPLAVLPADSSRAFRARGGVLVTSKSAFPMALHPEVRFAWS